MSEHTIIYYFTSTGNSLKIARDLSKELGEGTDLVFIPDIIAQNEIRTDADRVGIVYPVYMTGEPLMVSDLIRKLVLKKDAYVFAVCDYAGMRGASLEQTRGELKKTGIELSAGFGIKMPNNYTPLGEAVTGDRREEMFAEERKKVGEIAAAVKEKRKVRVRGSFLWRWMCRLIWKICAPMVPGCDKDFWLSEGCTSCGTCARVCPVDNIVMENGRPKWLHRCQSCLACLQWCPVSVIQYGRATRGRARYHNPEVTVEDIIRAGK